MPTSHDTQVMRHLSATLFAPPAAGEGGATRNPAVPNEHGDGSAAAAKAGAVKAALFESWLHQWTMVLDANPAAIDLTNIVSHILLI